MLILLSPAKSFVDPSNILPVNSSPEFSVPSFLDESKKLVDQLKKLSVKELEKLMKISPKLAELNLQRFQDFQLPFNEKNSNPALFLFDGDVYQAMEIKGYNKKDLEFCQKHLLILSGLYGILKPLDLMQKYRLEMGLDVRKIFGWNLASFWQKNIANFLNEQLANEQEKVIINLASNEYFSAVNLPDIDGRIINIVFKEKRGQEYKTIGLMAKKARGLMADFIIKNKIKKAEEIKIFDCNNYQYQQDFSDQNNWHFYK